MRGSPMHHEAMAALPPNADTALNALWQRVLSNEGSGVPRQQMKEVARTISACAHAADLRPEELVVAIKDSWSAHNGELHRWNKRSGAERVVTDVITLSIEEFFMTP